MCYADTQGLYNVMQAMKRFARNPNDDASWGRYHSKRFNLSFPLPDGKAWRYAGGVPGLATSGSGDVLAGVIAGLLARGGAPVQAAAWGVFLHGEAGRRLARRLGRLGFLARELLDEIPGVLAELEEG